MNAAHIVRPHITVLSSEQMDQIHSYSLEILSSVGVSVRSERARQLFARALGPTAFAADQVRLPRELIDWAMRSAPSFVDVYDREGNLAFRLGDGHSRFGIGTTDLYFQDLETDAVAPFGRRHMQQMVCLGNALPNFDFISTVGILQDLPPAVADLYAVLEMVANTTKPLVILVSETSLFAQVLDLVEELCGELATRPFVIPYLNPITPLTIDEGTVDKMFCALERGLPVVYNSLGMAGSTAPITPAGMLALLNAELLAGLTLSQLIRQGSVIILGALPQFFDMKTMDSFLHPKSFLLNLACAEMMARYGLPHCGTSGGGTGWGPDLLAAAGQWMNQLTACIGKVGLVPAIGSNLGSLAFSPCSVVYGHEVITQALIFAEGFAIGDELVRVEEIAQTGPSGHFLTSGLTLELLRQTHYSSRVFPRLNLDRWQERGRPQAIDLLRDYTRMLLDDLKAPSDCQDLVARGEAFIRRLKPDSSE
jgi:trimethylamine--corrinoid protein Co-methyltransferase